MMDQYRFPLPDRQAPLGSENPTDSAIQDHNEAKTWSTGHVDIIALVRSLQRAEGMADCFRIGKVDCDVIDCNWRSYCVGKRFSAPE